MISKVAPAGADTGLAVWFRKRDRQWLAANRRLMLWLLITVIAASLHLLLFPLASIFNDSLNLSQFVWITLGYSVSAFKYGLAIFVIHACLLRVENLRPPAEMLGVYSESDFQNSIRSRIIGTAVKMIALYYFPFQFVHELSWAWPIWGITTERVSMLLFGLSFDAIAAGSLILIISATCIHLPNLKLHLKSMMIAAMFIAILRSPGIIGRLIPFPSAITSLDSSEYQHYLLMYRLALILTVLLILIMATLFVIRRPRSIRQN